jgi:hypothetical protein
VHGRASACNREARASADEVRAGAGPRGYRSVTSSENDRSVPEFEEVGPPDDYQPDGMLARQIELVKGKPFDIKRAIREEWKAREQRGRWVAGNPAMKAKLTAYDHVLREHWSDRHEEMCEACAALEDDGKCASGLELLGAR